MKKHTKKAFGLFGLSLVAATTTFAATLPMPEATAVSNVTDTIVVRVVSDTPHVEFTGSDNGKIFYTPNVSFPYIYDNSKTVTITIEYTNTAGETHEYTLETIDANYAIGSGTLNLDLSSPNYGYGDYVLKIKGDHENAFLDEDSFEFSYHFLTADAKEDEETGDADVTINYDENNTAIKKFKLRVLNKNGEVVTEIPTITVVPPEKNALIPFTSSGLPSDTYIIEITAYDNNNNTLYVVNTDYVYESILVPNTGSLFAGLNISQADYLITGLIIFFVIGLGGSVFILKGNKNSKKRH